MMILGDEGHYNGRFPWVTAALIAINVAVFTVQSFLGTPFTNGFSLVPQEITEFRDIVRTQQVAVKVPVQRYHDHRGRSKISYAVKSVPIEHHPGPFPIVLTLFTSMFLHGGLMHLIGNMWFLGVFGRNVECALDHGRFLLFYVGCGVVGGLFHVVSDPHSLIPCLGASGAISGVMGAYVAIHPMNKIKLWFGWYFGVVELPALAVIGFWFATQYLYAFIALDRGIRTGVAYWDHIGGFLAGVGFVWGMVFYLRWQLAKAAAQAEEDAPPTEAQLAATLDAPPPDPFAVFISKRTPSETGMTADGPKP